MYAARLKRANSPSFVAIGQVAASGLALVTAPLVARAIGPEGRGETAAVLAAFYIWPIIVALGMPLEVRRASAVGQGEVALRRARRLMVLLPVPSVLIAVTLNATLFSQLDMSGRVVACIGLVLAPLMVSWMCDQSVLIGRKKYSFVALVQVCNPAIYLVMIVAGWVTGVISVSYVLAASIIGNGGSALLGAALTRVSIRGVSAASGPFMKNSLKYAGSSIAEASANRLDQLLALPVLGTLQAGYYAVAATVGTLGLPLGHALAADSFNAIARLTGDSVSRRAEEISHFRAAFSLSLVLCVFIVLFCPILIPILFGADFSGAIVPAIILCFGGAALVPAYVAALMLAAEGRGVEMTIAQCVRLILLIGLLIPLGWYMGVVAAALAAASVSWVLLAILTFRLTGSLKAWIVRPSDFPRGVRQLVRGSGSRS